MEQATGIVLGQGGVPDVLEGSGQDVYLRWFLDVGHGEAGFGGRDGEPAPYPDLHDRESSVEVACYVGQDPEVDVRLFHGFQQGSHLRSHHFDAAYLLVEHFFVDESAQDGRFRVGEKFLAFDA